MIYILKSWMLLLIINLLTFHISLYGTISRQSVGHIVDGKNPAPVHMSNIHQKHPPTSAQILSTVATLCRSLHRQSLHLSQNPSLHPNMTCNNTHIEKRYSHTDAKIFIDLIILMHSRQPWERNGVTNVFSLVSKFFRPKQSKKHWVLHGFGNTSNPSTDQLNHWQKWAIPPPAPAPAREPAPQQQPPRRRQQIPLTKK